MNTDTEVIQDENIEKSQSKNAEVSSDENTEISQKEFTVTLGKNATPVPSYEVFLIRGTPEYMEIQLATKTETDSEIRIHVESIFRINKDSVPQFAHQFADYLRNLGTQDSQI